MCICVCGGGDYYGKGSSSRTHDRHPGLTIVSGSTMSSDHDRHAGPTIVIPDHDRHPGPIRIMMKDYHRCRNSVRHDESILPIKGLHGPGQTLIDALFSDYLHKGQAQNFEIKRRAQLLHILDIVPELFGPADAVPPVHLRQSR